MKGREEGGREWGKCTVHYYPNNKNEKDLIKKKKWRLSKT